MTTKPKTLDFFPFSYALYNEYLDSYCWYCLGEKKNLKICDECKTAWYCNQECISLGWKDHKVECAALKKAKTIPDIEVRLLGRIAVRHKDILEGNDIKDPNFYLQRQSERKIMDIWAHIDEIKKDSHAMDKFERIYQELSTFYGNENLPDKEIVFQLHCRDFINRHAISDKHYLREIGKGLYLDLCAYDHSCAPNTIYVCNGLIATLCPLNSEVNITDRSNTFYSYIELIADKQQRRKLLRDTWYFNCECTRCVDDSEHILTSINCPYCLDEEKNPVAIFGEQLHRDPTTQTIICSKCKSQISQKDVVNGLTAMRFIMDLLEKQELEQMGLKVAKNYVTELKDRFNQYLSKYNIYYCKLVEALIKLTDPNDHAKVVELYLEVEHCVRTCFPNNHPALAFHLRNIGLEFYRLEKFDEAIKYLQEAYDMLHFVMPEGHPLEKSSKAVLATVQVKAKEKLEKQSSDVKEEKKMNGFVESREQKEVNDVEKEKEERTNQEAEVVSKNEDSVETPEVKNTEQKSETDLSDSKDKDICQNKDKEVKDQHEKDNTSSKSIKEGSNEKQNNPTDTSVPETILSPEKDNTKSDSCQIIISQSETESSQENKTEELMISTDPEKQKESTAWRSKDTNLSPNSSPQPSPSVLNQVATHEIRRRIAETFLADEEELPELR
ncbi:hypothetical protein FO519_004323 [Halicephalobus sp. NKZ332]|nr:hypothetical protein FO519_004323 [Halicephalobus sp. NKZ332]